MSPLFARFWKQVFLCRLFQSACVITITASCECNPDPKVPFVIEPKGQQAPAPVDSTTTLPSLLRGQEHLTPTHEVAFSTHKVSVADEIYGSLLVESPPPHAWIWVKTPMRIEAANVLISGEKHVFFQYTLPHPECSVLAARFEWNDAASQGTGVFRFSCPEPTHNNHIVIWFDRTQSRHVFLMHDPVFEGFEAAPAWASAKEILIDLKHSPSLPNLTLKWNLQSTQARLILDEPKKSLENIASTIAGWVKRKKHPQVEAATSHLLTLWNETCRESRLPPSFVWSSSSNPQDLRAPTQWGVPCNLGLPWIRSLLQMRLQSLLQQKKLDQVLWELSTHALTLSTKNQKTWEELLPTVSTIPLVTQRLGNIALSHVPKSLHPIALQWIDATHLRVATPSPRVYDTDTQSWSDIAEGLFSPHSSLLLPNNAGTPTYYVHALANGCLMDHGYVLLQLPTLQPAPNGVFVPMDRMSTRTSSDVVSAFTQGATQILLFESPRSQFPQRECKAGEWTSPLFTEEHLLGWNAQGRVTTTTYHQTNPRDLNPSSSHLSLAHKNGLLYRELSSKHSQIYVPNDCACADSPRWVARNELGTHVAWVCESQLCLGHTVQGQSSPQ